MGLYNYIKDWIKDYGSKLLTFYGVFGISSIPSLIDTIQNSKTPIYLIIYYIIIGIAPLLYYLKDHNKIIRVVKKNINHVRENAQLFLFEIITHSDTKSDFPFRVGSRINSYFLLFSKFPDIDMNFSLPNNRNFTQIERRNKVYYIIECKKNLINEYPLTINSVNKVKKSTKKTFEIWYSKADSFDISMKKKKIHECKILCAP